MTVYCIGVVEPLVADTPRVEATDGGEDVASFGGMVEGASIVETLP